MKRNLKLRAVVSPTPIIYDEERFASRPVGEASAKAFNAGLTYKNDKP